MFGLAQRLLGGKADPSSPKLPSPKDTAVLGSEEDSASGPTTPGSTFTNTPSAVGDATPATPFKKDSKREEGEVGDDENDAASTAPGLSRCGTGTFDTDRSFGTSVWDSITPTSTTNSYGGKTPKCFGARAPFGKVLSESVAPIPEEHEHKETAPPGLLPSSGDAAPLSIGSKLHEEGDCSPCVWFWKPQGCLRGLECGYCHLCPEGEVKVRKKVKLAAIRTGSSMSPMSAGAVTPSHAALKEEPQTPVTELQLEDSEIQDGKSSEPKVDRQPEQSEPLKIEFGELPGLFEPGSTLGSEASNFNGLEQEPKKVNAVPEAFMIPQASQGTAPIKPPPGLAAPASVPSFGSSLHGTGLCKPCAWLWKPQGCQNGQECRHCHLCPEGEIKARRKVKVNTLRLEKDEQDQTPTKKQEICLAEALAHGPDSSFDSEGDSDDDATPLVARGPSGLGDADTPAFVPSAAQHVIPSPGSAMHGTGMCRPCAWFWKKHGCENGDECRHCHLCPEEEIKNRRKMKVSVLRTQSSQELMAGWPMTPAMMAPALTPQAPASLVLNGAGGLHMTASLPAATLASEAAELGSEEEQSPQEGASPKTPVPIALATSLPLPSSGSALHLAGKCRPCAWFWKPQGCMNGNACAHCHLCPEDELKNRKKVKESAMRVGAQTPKLSDLESRTPRTVRIAPILLGV